MGYSCTVAASLVVDAIGAAIKATMPEEKSSNMMPGGGFWERGRENRDGAITGTIWRKLNDAEKAKWSTLDNLDSRVVRAGSFKVSAEGKVVRWPGLPKAMLVAAEKAGAEEFTKRYGSK